MIGILVFSSVVSLVSRIYYLRRGKWNNTSLKWKILHLILFMVSIHILSRFFIRVYCSLSTLDAASLDDYLACCLRCDIMSSEYMCAI